MYMCSSRAGEAAGPVGCGALSGTSSSLPPHAVSYKAVAQAMAENPDKALWVCLCFVVVAVVMLLCGMGTPVSSTAVAQNQGSALPSDSLHEP